MGSVAHSYLVGQRRREIGIRLAVGASRSNVFRLVAAAGIKLIALGAILGTGLSIGAAFGLRSLLIGVRPTDPVTCIAVFGLLTLVAMRVHASVCPFRSVNAARSGLLTSPVQVC